jgi:hypothetical protein
MNNTFNVTFQTDQVMRILKAYSLMAQTQEIPVSRISPPKGFRTMYQLSKMSNAYLSYYSPSKQIVHRLRAMPETKLFSANTLNFDIGTLLGSFVYPFGVTFLLPIFVLILVKEKEDKIVIMMRMSGMSYLTYYFSNYCHFMALQILNNIVFILTGVAFGLKFFTRTDPAIYIILFLLWANVMVGMAFLLSLVFDIFIRRLFQKVDMPFL